MLLQYGFVGKSLSLVSSQKNYGRTPHACGFLLRQPSIRMSEVIQNPVSLIFFSLPLIFTRVLAGSSLRRLKRVTLGYSLGITTFAVVPQLHRQGVIRPVQYDVNTAVFRRC